MKTELLRFNSTLEHDPAIDAWLQARSESRAAELGAIAHRWWKVIRHCGDEVREILHDGCPVACFGDVPFAYVNAFTAHVNLGFFQGASLPDPARLLEGNGKSMRHIKLRPGISSSPDISPDTNAASIMQLIETAYADIKVRVENG